MQIVNEAGRPPASADGISSISRNICESYINCYFKKTLSNLSKMLL